MQTVILVNARKENRLRSALLGPELPLRPLLAARTLMNDFSVELCDPAAQRRTWPRIARLLRGSPLALVLVFSDLGIDTGGDELMEASRITRSVKTFCNVPVVWAGVPSSFLARLILADGQVAAVTDSEEPLGEVCRQLSDGKDLLGIPGVWTNDTFSLHPPSGENEVMQPVVYGDQAGKVEPVPAAGDDLDFFPLPVFLLPIQRYVRTTAFGPHIPLETSRGCTGRCAFCNNRSRGRWRGVAADVLFEEVHRLNRFLGVRAFSFIDDNFFMDFQRAGRFFELVVKSGLKLSFDLQGVRADVVDRLERSELGLMERAGCIKLSIGVETGSERLLEKMGKDLDLQCVHRLNRRLAGSRICPQYHFILGLPGETYSDFSDTVSLVKTLLGQNPRACFYPFFYQPVPGSVLWNEVVETVAPPESLAGWGPFLESCRCKLKRSVPPGECQALYLALAGLSHRGFVRGIVPRTALGLYAPVAGWRLRRDYLDPFPETWIMDRVVGLPG